LAARGWSVFGRLSAEETLRSWDQETKTSGNLIWGLVHPSGVSPDLASTKPTVSNDKENAVA
jgi:hypothetical protein